MLPELLYGTGHAYGNPLTGTGTEESVRKLTRDDLVKFHSTWFKPNNATLVVVGDTTLGRDRAEARGAVRGLEEADGAAEEEPGHGALPRQARPST